jgi:hypothetical protein
MIPVLDKASCRIPVTIIHERKCGRYEMVCTVFLPPFDFTSFNNMANKIAMTNVTIRLITPMPSVFLITRIKLASENSCLNLSIPTKAE